MAVVATTKVILLEGDKKTKAEPATHIIKFPGGSVELSRTSDDEYWVHLEVNREIVSDDMGVRERKLGLVVDSRIDCTYDSGRGIEKIANCSDIQHIALRVATKK